MSMKSLFAIAAVLLVAGAPLSARASGSARCRLTNVARHAETYNGDCRVETSPGSSGNTIYKIQLASAEPFLFAGQGRSWMHGSEDATFDKRGDGGTFRWGDFELTFHSGGGGSSSGDHSGREWDRGCSDAKAGSYDRSKHSDAYEQGWKSCNKPQGGSSSGGNHDARERERGCSDAKAGSYDRSKHSDAYEQGWQSCNDQRGGSREAARPGRGPSNAAESGCMQAVNDKYNGNVGNISIVSSEFSQANTDVTLDADGQKWRCLASSDGEVQELRRR